MKVKKRITPYKLLKAQSMSQLNTIDQRKDTPAPQKKNNKIRKPKNRLSAKKASQIGPGQIVLEYFSTCGTQALFAKMVRFYEKELKHPLLAFLLKKFLMLVSKRKNNLSTMSLKKFVLKLRKARGVIRLFKKERHESTV